MAQLQVDFFSKKLKRHVTIKAVIPNDSDHPGRENPEGIRTLYLLHGYTGNCTDWLTETQIQEYAAKYRLAVIMPSGENSFYLDDEDKSEFFGEFIGEELVEYTRKLFPLSHRREDTFIGGLSMGGYGAMRNGLKYSENFSKIMSFSGAFIQLYIIENGGKAFDDNVTTAAYKARIFGDLKTLATSSKNPSWLVDRIHWDGQDVPDIFMTCGTEDDLLSVNRETKKQLEAAGADVTYIEDEGSHNWDYWNKHLEKAIRWALRKKPL
jgi:putative tributyrin esterase